MMAKPVLFYHFFTTFLVLRSGILHFVNSFILHLFHLISDASISIGFILFFLDSLVVMCGFKEKWCLKNIQRSWSKKLIFTSGCDQQKPLGIESKLTSDYACFCYFKCNWFYFFSFSFFHKNFIFFYQYNDDSYLAYTNNELKKKKKREEKLNKNISSMCWVLELEYYGSDLLTFKALIMLSFYFFTVIKQSIRT